jgi:hypothetical protein
MKKTWSKPQLVVLHRDKAEAVLAICKVSAPPGPNGPTSINWGVCYQLPCQACSTHVGS